MSRRLLLALPLALLLAACGEKPVEDTPIRPVRSLLAASSSVVPEVTYAGEVRARYETPQGFRVAGKLAERKVEIGDRVKKGQLLARLDPEDLRLSALAAKAGLSAAESDFRRSSADFERYKALFSRKLIAESEFKARKTEFDVAEAKVKQARAQYDVNINQTGYAELRAEFDGVVTALNAERGQVVAAGQGVVTIARPDELEVEVSIPESRVANIREAADLSVTLWAKPGLKIPGRLRELAPDTDPVTRTYRARISLLEHDPEIQLGMTANVHVSSRESEVIKLPLTAIFQSKQQPTVWVVDEKSATVHNVPVRIRQYLDNEVVIESGVTPGQRIVTAGVHKLVEGQKVALGGGL